MALVAESAQSILTRDIAGDYLKVLNKVSDSNEQINHSTFGLLFVELTIY